MKLLWTRNPKPATSRPVSQAAPAAAKECAPTRSPVSRVPETLPRVPFDPETCLVLDPIAEAQQLAFSAHRRSHPTAAAFWAHAPAADWMLDVLRKSWDLIPLAPEAGLRTFALRCVEKLQGADAPGLAELRAAVERRVTGQLTTRELQDLRAKTKPLVTIVGAHGIPRFSPQAAGQLAVWHSANPSPYEAAMWTAEFAAFHDAFVALAQAAESWVPPSAVPDEWRAAYYAQQHPEARAGAIRRANERQAVLLKSILPQPFVEAAVLGRAS